MTHHKLVIAEKPSVAQSIAAVLCATLPSMPTDVMYI